MAAFNLTANPVDVGRAVRDGGLVTLDYTIRLQTGGPVLDSGQVDFTPGTSALLPRLEKEILGLRQGDWKREIVLKPEEGSVRATIVEVPRSLLPDAAQVGALLTVKTDPTAAARLVRVLEINDLNATASVDFNPLAGPLVFDLHIVAVQPKT